MKRPSFDSRWLLALCLTPLFGCPEHEIEPEVSLYRVTNPPPTLVTELFDTDDRQEIRMSIGTAMGVACHDYCEDQTTSCSGLVVSSADENVIAVHDAFRGNGQQTVVLSAAAQGTTSIRVITACGSKTYRAVAID